MGQNKSKDFDPNEAAEANAGGASRAEVVRRDSHASSDERRRRRKWRKKQGYSLPGAGATAGKVDPEEQDLPPAPAERGAVLVSYSRSDAERFAPLRPKIVSRRNRQSSCDDLSSSVDFYDTPTSVRSCFTLDHNSGDLRFQPCDSLASIAQPPPCDKNVTSTVPNLMEIQGNKIPDSESKTEVQKEYRREIEKESLYSKVNKKDLKQKQVDDRTERERRHKEIEEMEKRLKEQEERTEREKKFKELTEKVEREKRLKEIEERTERDRKFKELTEKVEREKRLKEIEERIEREKKFKEQEERIEMEKRFKEQEERERKFKEQEERKEREKRLKEHEEREKRLKEQEERTEREKRLKEVTEKAEREKKRKELEEKTTTEKEKKRKESSATKEAATTTTTTEEVRQEHLSSGKNSVAPNFEKCGGVGSSPTPPPLPPRPPTVAAQPTPTQNQSIIVSELNPDEDKKCLEVGQKEEMTHTFVKDSLAKDNRRDDILPDKNLKEDISSKDKSPENNSVTIRLEGGRGNVGKHSISIPVPSTISNIIKTGHAPDLFKSFETTEEASVDDDGLELLSLSGDTEPLEILQEPVSYSSPIISRRIRDCLDDSAILIDDDVIAAAESQKIVKSQNIIHKNPADHGPESKFVNSKHVNFCFDKKGFNTETTNLTEHQNLDHPSPLGFNSNTSAKYNKYDSGKFDHRPGYNNMFDHHFVNPGFSESLEQQVADSGFVDPGLVEAVLVDVDEDDDDVFPSFHNNLSVVRPFGSDVLSAITEEDKDEICSNLSAVTGSLDLSFSKLDDEDVNTSQTDQEFERIFQTLNQNPEQNCRIPESGSRLLNTSIENNPSADRNTNQHYKVIRSSSSDPRVDGEEQKPVLKSKMDSEIDFVDLKNLGGQKSNVSRFKVNRDNFEKSNVKNYSAGNEINKNNVAIVADKVIHNSDNISKAGVVIHKNEANFNDVKTSNEHQAKKILSNKNASKSQSDFEISQNFDQCNNADPSISTKTPSVSEMSQNYDKNLSKPEPNKNKMSNASETPNSNEKDVVVLTRSFKENPFILNDSKAAAKNEDAKTGKNLQQEICDTKKNNHIQNANPILESFSVSQKEVVSPSKEESSKLIVSAFQKKEFELESGRDQVNGHHHSSYQAKVKQLLLERPVAQKEIYSNDNCNGLTKTRDKEVEKVENLVSNQTDGSGFGSHQNVLEDLSSEALNVINSTDDINHEPEHKSDEFVFDEIRLDENYFDRVDDVAFDKVSLIIPSNENLTSTTDEKSLEFNEPTSEEPSTILDGFNIVPAQISSEVKPKLLAVKHSTINEPNKQTGQDHSAPELDQTQSVSPEVKKLIFKPGKNDLTKSRVEDHLELITFATENSGSGRDLDQELTFKNSEIKDLNLNDGVEKNKVGDQIIKPTPITRTTIEPTLDVQIDIEPGVKDKDTSPHLSEPHLSMVTESEDLNRCPSNTEDKPVVQLEPEKNQFVRTINNGSILAENLLSNLSHDKVGLSETTTPSSELHSSLCNKTKQQKQIHSKNLTSEIQNATRKEVEIEKSKNTNAQRENKIDTNELDNNNGTYRNSAAEGSGKKVEKPEPKERQNLEKKRSNVEKSIIHIGKPEVEAERRTYKSAVQQNTVESNNKVRLESTVDEHDEKTKCGLPNESDVDMRVKNESWIREQFKVAIINRDRTQETDVDGQSSSSSSSCGSHDIVESPVQIRTEKRLPPVGCSSEDHASSGSASEDLEKCCYDSLEEDLGGASPKRSSGKEAKPESVPRRKRSLPPVPADFSDQQKRAYEALLDHQQQYLPPSSVNSIYVGSGASYYVPYIPEKPVDYYDRFPPPFPPTQNYYDDSWRQPQAPSYYQEEPVVQKVNLDRSRTFNFPQIDRSRKRCLPQVPVDCKEQVSHVDPPEVAESAPPNPRIRKSAERDKLPQAEVRPPRWANQAGFMHLSGEEDSGCASLDRSSVSPQPAKNKDPLQQPEEEERGASSFMWFDLTPPAPPPTTKKQQETSVVRRPKKNDVPANKNRTNRHSAPPGSLDFQPGSGSCSGDSSRATTGATSRSSSKASLKTDKSQIDVKRRRSTAICHNEKRKEPQSQSRIHSAVVSGINLDSRSVTVEWFERGETKGKEIELDAILILNQDLAPQNENSNLIPNKLSKSDRHSFAQTRSYVPRPSVVTSQQNNRAAAVSSAAIAPPSQGSVSSGGQAALGRTRNNKATRPTMNGAEISQHAQLQQQQLQQQQIQQQQQKYQQQQAAAAAAAAASEAQMDDGQNGMDGGSGKQGAGWGRRSNVVKQVERLKKNREERRAKQAEILEEKTAQKDPGNPNWEFLSMIKEYQEQLEFNPLQEGDAIIDHQITVCVRKRPLNKKEKQKKEVDVVTIPNKDQTIVHEPKTKVDLTKYLDNQHFRFDYAFDETCSNELVYKYSARPLVQNIFEGGMATCFAYGQTGSGKTHTMGGEFHGKTQDSKNGIYALATKDVFKFLNLPKYKPMKLQVSCSYFEIYSGKVFDLLSGKSKLRVLEDGKQQVVVVGLVEKTVESVDDVLKLINLGNNVRTSGQTSANAHSSRSHAVFQIILRQGAKKSVYGKFSLIDLAGNERGADTSSANRQTRMEGAEINKSLLALKECIRALGRKGAHLPFRASKLTQVLRDSFIGEKSKTCMIAMVSPGLSSCEHSLNTLRYADRVKELGAEDPALQKASPTENGHEDDMRLDDGVMSPEDSDLAQLRSLNEGELSADWYNFQEAVTHLQALEEDLVDAHRSVIVNMQQWASDDAMLLAMTNEVDYDQDAYCQQLEEMIADKIEAFSNLREKARYFRECLNDEESKSRLLVRRN